MNGRLLRKETSEKLQKIPPKVAIFTTKKHYTKKNKYTVMLRINTPLKAKNLI